MTFAPRELLKVRHFFQGMYPWLSNEALGIVGGPSHIAAGTSYHLGRDQLKMSKDPYSARLRRDREGLSNAASAFDLDDALGGGPKELQQLSIWMVDQCRRQAPDTLNIREIIYSPDGVAVLTWDRERGVSSYPMPRGSITHREHSHFSYYRDTEGQDKVNPFRRFYASKTMKELGMLFLKIAGGQNPEIWVSNGVNTRYMPPGQWELTIKPMLDANVAVLREYPSMEALLAAGGPLVSSEPPTPGGSVPPITDEQLERVLRKVYGSLG